VLLTPTFLFFSFFFFDSRRLEFPVYVYAGANLPSPLSFSFLLAWFAVLVLSAGMVSPEPEPSGDIPFSELIIQKVSAVSFERSSSTDFFPPAKNCATRLLPLYELFFAPPNC